MIRLGNRKAIIFDAFPGQDLAKLMIYGRCFMALAQFRAVRTRNNFRLHRFRHSTARIRRGIPLGPNEIRRVKAGIPGS